MHDHDREGGGKVGTRCKVQCIGVEKSKGFGTDSSGKLIEFIYNSRFAFVTSGSEENKQFFASTPGGDLRVASVREDHFVPGKTYYVDFTEAPA